MCLANSQSAFKLYLILVNHKNERSQHGYTKKGPSLIPRKPSTCKTAIHSLCTLIEFNRTHPSRKINCNFYQCGFPLYFCNIILLGLRDLIGLLPRCQEKSASNLIFICSRLTFSLCPVDSSRGTELPFSELYLSYFSKSVDAKGNVIEVHSTYFLNRVNVLYSHFLFCSIR